MACVGGYLMWLFDIQTKPVLPWILLGTPTILTDPDNAWFSFIYAATTLGYTVKVLWGTGPSPDGHCLTTEGAEIEIAYRLDQGWMMRDAPTGPQSQHALKFLNSTAISLIEGLHEF